MSNYFRTLLRLERERRPGTDGAPGEDAAEAPVFEPPAADGHAAGGLDDLELIESQAALANLLEGLRALDKVAQIPAIVIAGVAVPDPARSVLRGLIEQAVVRGIRLGVAELTLSANRRVIELRPTGGAADSDAAAATGALSFELTGTGVHDALREWIEATAAAYDLLIIEAPPLLSSVDAALAARACDGLVLVAQPLATQRDEFEAAIDRARSAGCRMLGLVMDGTRPWLPRFLRRILTSYPRTIRPREGSE